MDDKINEALKGEHRIINIGVNNYETFFEYQQTLGEIFTSNAFTSLSETKQRFASFDTLRMSGMYVAIKLNSEYDKDFKSFSLESEFQRRVKMIQLNYNYNQDEVNLNLLNIFMSEILSFTPEFDNNFRNQCYTFIFESISKIFNVLEPIITEKLNLISKNHLIDLEYHINEKSYWDEKQIQSIIFSHLHFLDEEFHKIIMNIKNKAFRDIIYENFMLILSAQQKTDQEVLKTDIFKKYIEFINIKKTTSLINPYLVSKKSANYVLKEKSIDKQIKITIDAEELDKYIENDF